MKPIEDMSFGGFHSLQCALLNACGEGLMLKDLSRSAGKSKAVQCGFTFRDPLRALDYDLGRLWSAQLQALDYDG